MEGVFSQLVINSIIAGSVYVLIAVGFNLVYGATRFFNIAHGVMATVGAYAVFFFSRTLDLDVWLAVLLGVLVAGFAGWLLDRGLYLPLRRRKVSVMVLLVASLGAFTALQALIAIIFTSNFQILSKGVPGSQPVFTVFGGVITQIQIFIILAAVLVVLGLALLLKCTLFGTSVRAVSDDEEVSKIVGINTNRVIGLVFFIGSAIAGLGGILVAYDTALEPGMGMVLLLKGVIAAIIGGVGSLWGGVLGAFLLGFVENFGIWKISGEWKDAIAFGVLILFLIFRPRGILGT